MFWRSVSLGVNFPLYDSARVHKVYALEPNKWMPRRANCEKLVCGSEGDHPTI
jgi:hypothetical protein